MSDNTEFLNMQFPGKDGSDIHRIDEQKELENIISSILNVNMPLRKSTKEIAAICAKKITETSMIDAVYEGAEQWKEEYDMCRDILIELVNLKKLKDKDGKTEDYLKRQPLVWEAARVFLQKYQHS